MLAKQVLSQLSYTPTVGTTFILKHFRPFQNPFLLFSVITVPNVSMPLMNGFDASLEILKLSPQILILLYTSYLTAQLVEEAHRAGIRGTVSKDAMQAPSGLLKCEKCEYSWPMTIGTFWS